MKENKELLRDIFWGTYGSIINNVPDHSEYKKAIKRFRDVEDKIKEILGDKKESNEILRLLNDYQDDFYETTNEEMYSFFLRGVEFGYSMDKILNKTE